MDLCLCPETPVFKCLSSISWRWKVDDPEFIVQGVLENHYKMIKQLKGVPGVKAERFQEAFDVKHCALSLVGEPIFVSIKGGSA